MTRLGKFPVVRTPTTTRWTVYFLRLIAVCQLLAFAAVFVPVRIWLAGWYEWLRLGQPPEISAILHYDVGATAFFQGAIGVWLWIMLSDVDRYRQLLLATAIIYLLAVPAFYFIDTHAGLPLWWRIYDCIWCLSVSGALFALCRRSNSHREMHTSRSE
jgi:hypothetical protein